MRKCSICDQIGHYKNNRKYHTKQEIEEYDNKVLARMIVGNIFRNIIKANNKMDFQSTNNIIDIIHKNNCILFENTIFNSSDTEIGYWYEDGHVKDKDKKIVNDINSLFKRKNCDNKPSEFIEALCHIIPNMKTKDDIPNEKPTNLIISNKNFKTYLKNIMEDKKDYKTLIKNKYEDIKKYNFDEDIKYAFIPGKFSDEDIIPQEIKDLINDYDIKENKADYFIKFINYNKPLGFSVKDDCKATKTNYSVQTCIEGIDPDLSKRLNKLKKDICKENGVTNSKPNDPNSSRNNEKRKILNETFKRDDLYHTTINTFIMLNKDYVKNYLTDNMYSVNINYPIYECINGRISNVNKNNIIESKLEAYPEAELRQNGEVRDIAKLFYKLTIKFSDDTKKLYEIQTRIKGDWWSASIQFQCHII